MVACINSPSSITISGDADQVEALRVLLDEHKVFARKLKVDVAYHSQHMNLIATQYGSSIRDLAPGEANENSPVMVSSVTGQEVTKNELCKADYWVGNMVSPVQFSKALKVLCDTPEKKSEKSQNLWNINTLVEVGPHSALWGPIKDILKTFPSGEKVEYHSCLTRNIPATRSLFGALGRMHCRGVPVDFRRINRSVGVAPALLSVVSDLPEYPFNHSRTYWKEGRLSRESRFRRHAKLDLLGKPVVDWNPLEARWRNFIKFSELPWIESHKASIPSLEFVQTNSHRSIMRSSIPGPVYWLWPLRQQTK